MTVTTTPPITLDMFLQRPETEPASEYIEGKIIQQPMPKGKHSRLQGKLCAVVNQATEAQRIAYNFELPPDWTVEILSPEQKANKVIGNILHYLIYGTRLGWFVDPEAGI